MLDFRKHVEIDPVIDPSAVAAAIAAQLHSDLAIFIKPHGQLCVILPISSATIPFFAPLFSNNYSRFLDPPIILKIIPE